MDDVVYERVSHPDECTCLVCLMGQEIERLRQEVDIKGSRLDDALDETDRLNNIITELKAHTQWLTQTAQERIHGGPQ